MSEQQQQQHNNTTRTTKPATVKKSATSSKKPSTNVSKVGGSSTSRKNIVTSVDSNSCDTISSTANTSTTSAKPVVTTRINNKSSTQNNLSDTKSIPNTSTKDNKTPGTTSSKSNTGVTKKMPNSTTGDKHSSHSGSSTKRLQNGNCLEKGSSSSLGKRKSRPNKHEDSSSSSNGKSTKKSSKRVLQSLESIIGGRQKLVLGEFLGTNYATFSGGAILKLDNAVTGNNTWGLRRLPKNVDARIINQTGEIDSLKYKEFLEENYELIKDYGNFYDIRDPDKIVALSNLTELWCSKEGFLIPLSKIRPVSTKTSLDDDTTESESGESTNTPNSTTVLQLLPIDEYFIIPIINLARHPLYSGSISRLRTDPKFKELVITSGNIVSLEDISKGAYVPDSYYIFYGAEHITTKSVIANGKPLYLRPSIDRGNIDRIAELENALISHTKLLIGTGQDVRNIEIVFKNTTLSSFSDSVSNSSIISPSYHTRPVTSVPVLSNVDGFQVNQQGTLNKSISNLDNVMSIDTTQPNMRSPKVQSFISTATTNTSTTPKISNVTTNTIGRNSSSGLSTINSGVSSFTNRHNVPKKMNTVGIVPSTGYSLDNMNIVGPNTSVQNNKLGYLKDGLNVAQSDTSDPRSNTIIPPFIYHKSYDDLHLGSKTENLYKALSFFAPRDSNASEMVEYCKNNISLTIGKLTELSNRDSDIQSDSRETYDSNQELLLLQYANLVGSAFIMGSLSSQKLFITVDDTNNT